MECHTIIIPAKQITFKSKQYLRFIYYLLTVYDTRSGRAKHVFCRDTFGQTEFFSWNTT